MARVKIRKPGYENRNYQSAAQCAPRRRQLVEIVKDMTHDGKSRVGVRQVAYQFVVRGFSGGDKSDATMKKVGEDLVKLRRGDVAGMRLDYEWFADDSRRVRTPLTFDSISQRLDQVAENYRRSLWTDTPDYVEVFLEKEGLAGIVEEETDPFDVPLFPVRGYNSVTGLYEAAQRYKARAHQNIFVYVLGDFDPSGLNAVEVAEEFIRHQLKGSGVKITFTRLAMNEDDWGNPDYAVAVRETKGKDPRTKKHVAKYGRMSSLELDAMPPDDLRTIVREAIENHVDWDALNDLREAEERDRARLREIAEREAGDET